MWCDMLLPGEVSRTVIFKLRSPMLLKFLIIRVICLYPVVSLKDDLVSTLGKRPIVSVTVTVTTTVLMATVDWITLLFNAAG